MPLTPKTRAYFSSVYWSLEELWRWPYMHQDMDSSLLASMGLLLRTARLLWRQYERDSPSWLPFVNKGRSL